MKSEQLHNANKINSKIEMIDQMELEAGRFRKERFSGSIPSSITRYLSGNGDLTLKTVEYVLSEALKERETLKQQLNEL